MSTEFKTKRPRSTKGFLRRVAKSGYQHDWILYAGEYTAWKVRFIRRGAQGMTVAEYEIDSEVCLRGRTGLVSPFGGEDFVQVPQCVSIALHREDAKVAAGLLARGWSLTVRHSSGSSSSSRRGLAFIYLELSRGCKSLTIGGQAVFVDGVQVISGACGT